MIPIEPSSLEDDEVAIKCHWSEKEFYAILNRNTLHLDRLLPIKWSNDVLKKLWYVNGNTAPKLKNFLVAGTLNNSLTSFGQKLFHITSTNSLKVLLYCSTNTAPDFCISKFKIGCT